MRLVDASATTITYKEDSLYRDINGNHAALKYYDQSSSSDDDEDVHFGNFSEADTKIVDSRNHLNSMCTTIGLFRRRGSDQLGRSVATSTELPQTSRNCSLIPDGPSDGIRNPPDLSLGSISRLKTQRGAASGSTSLPVSPVSGPPSPDSDIDWFDRASTNLCGSPFSSPRTKRKSIDITKSAAYKEIYADKLRLYSVVLSKHVADSGEVGRQMNELRKARSKNKALKAEKPSSTNNMLKPPARNRRSQSANSVLLQQQIAEWRSTTELVPQVERRNSFPKVETGLVRSRSMMLLQESTIAEASSESNMMHDNRGSCVDLRVQAASERIQERRRKLESFDMALDKTNSFLQRVKQQNLAPAS